MGYRLPDDRCHEHRLHINDSVRQVTLSVDNGTISNIAIPVFYFEHHDHKMHDHLGWPRPGMPDHSCQVPYDYILTEVDLNNEGYDSIEVLMTDPPDGLEFTGDIGDGVITLHISSMCPDAASEDLYVIFTAYAVGTIDNDYDESDVQMRDIATKGTLHIVAGPIA